MRLWRRAAWCSTHRILFASLGVLAGISGGSVTFADICASDDGGAGVVVEVLDRQLLALDDARVVSLAGLQFPRFVGYGGLQVDTGTMLKAVLAQLTLGQKVKLRHAGRKTDRYGRHLAYVDLQIADKAVGLQSRLVEMGLAQVDASQDRRACASALLAVEEKARRAGAGFWGQGLFRIRDAKSALILKPLIGTFQIVEGAVVEASEAKGSVQLSFGGDAKSNFTIFVDAKSAKLFKPPALGPAQLKGRSIRARGWLIYKNGPALQVTHPEQIEIVANNEAARPAN